MTQSPRKKGRYAGLLGTLLVHVGFVAILLLVGVTAPPQEEEGGMELALGDVSDAGGTGDPTLVDVEVMPEAPPANPQPAEDVPLMTQDVEETVTVEDGNEQDAPTAQPTEAELAEQARREARLKAEQERREAEETARRRVAGAFGKGAKMESKGTGTGTNIQGNPAGNVSNPAATGSGGYGNFSLNGRSLGEGGLPRPVYTVQDEGKVVVTITVNPAGQVVETSINPQTNTVNPALRRAALDAARKARFNAISGMNNQMGTITYYFNLKQ